MVVREGGGGGGGGGDVPTSSVSNTWHSILACFLLLIESVSPGLPIRRLRAISTRISPMSAMYEMVRSEWSIIISCNTQ